MRLRNKFLNTESEMNRKTYKKQCTCCVTLIRKAKQIFFCNINTADVTDNKTFWRIVKHFFTDKVTTRSKVTVIEKKEWRMIMTYLIVINFQGGLRG